MSVRGVLAAAALTAMLATPAFAQVRTTHRWSPWRTTRAPAW